MHGRVRLLLLMSFEEVTIGSARLIRCDCREVLPTLGPVDAVVTDPPYALVGASTRGKYAMNAVAQKKLASLVRGFMGQTWDNGIAFDPETWRAVIGALRPGGMLLAFGGTRTHHRMVCAIEDAGFVIQDTIAWLYGSGFPKNRTLLKPAFEPIVVAYKPGGPRTLQVDECRVGTGADKGEWPITDRRHDDKCWTLPPTLTDRTRGRWPANVIHSGEPEVMQAFAAFGESKSVPGVRRNSYQNGVALHNGTPRDVPVLHDDTGTAARFYYCAKAPKSERLGSKHPTQKPLALMTYLVRLVAPPGALILDPFMGSGTTGVGCIDAGRRFVGVEQDKDYFRTARDRIRRAQAAQITAAAA